MLCSLPSFLPLHVSRRADGAIWKKRPGKLTLVGGERFPVEALRYQSIIWYVPVINCGLKITPPPWVCVRMGLLSCIVPHAPSIRTDNKLSLRQRETLAHFQKLPPTVCITRNGRRGHDRIVTRRARVSVECPAVWNDYGFGLI